METVIQAPQEKTLYLHVLAFKGFHFPIFRHLSCVKIILVRVEAGIMPVKIP